MLARIHKSMKDKDEGFTLIELLVVMIIIGILAAIAIPVFLNQRKKAVDTGVKSDVTNAGKNIAAYYVDGTLGTLTAAITVDSTTNIATLNIGSSATSTSDIASMKLSNNGTLFGCQAATCTPVATASAATAGGGIGISTGTGCTAATGWYIGLVNTTNGSSTTYWYSAQGGLTSTPKGTAFSGASAACSGS